MFACDANAFSVSPVPSQSSNVTLVAGGCGLGFHRGPYGGCRPNVVGYPAVGYGGGVYRGGVYRGGVYRGGVYRGAYTIAVACTVAVAFTIAAAGFVAERADC